MRHFFSRIYLGFLRRKFYVKVNFRNLLYFALKWQQVFINKIREYHSFWLLVNNETTVDATQSLKTWKYAMSGLNLFILYFFMGVNIIFFELFLPAQYLHVPSIYFQFMFYFFWRSFMCSLLCVASLLYLKYIALTTYKLLT